MGGSLCRSSDTKVPRSVRDVKVLEVILEIFSLMPDPGISPLNRFAAPSPVPCIPVGLSVIEESRPGVAHNLRPPLGCFPEYLHRFSLMNRFSCEAWWNTHPRFFNQLFSLDPLFILWQSYQFLHSVMV